MDEHVCKFAAHLSSRLHFWSLTNLIEMIEVLVGPLSNLVEENV